LASNRKSVVNDNRIEAVQPSWFTVPFVCDTTEKLSRLNSERIRVSFIVNNNKLREFIKVHKNHIRWNTSTCNVITEVTREP